MRMVNLKDRANHQIRTRVVTYESEPSTLPQKKTIMKNKQQREVF